MLCCVAKAIVSHPRHAGPPQSGVRYSWSSGNLTLSHSKLASLSSAGGWLEKPPVLLKYFLSRVVLAFHLIYNDPHPGRQAWHRFQLFPTPLRSHPRSCKQGSFGLNVMCMALNNSSTQPDCPDFPSFLWHHGKFEQGRGNKKRNEKGCHFLRSVKFIVSWCCCQELFRSCKWLPFVHHSVMNSLNVYWTSIMNQVVWHVEANRQMTLIQRFRGCYTQESMWSHFQLVGSSPHLYKTRFLVA